MNLMKCVPLMIFAIVFPQMGEKNITRATLDRVYDNTETPIIAVISICDFKLLNKMIIQVIRIRWSLSKSRCSRCWRRARASRRPTRAATRSTLAPSRYEEGMKHWSTGFNIFLWFNIEKGVISSRMSSFAYCGGEEVISRAWNFCDTTLKQE